MTDVPSPPQPAPDAVPPALRDGPYHAVRDAWAAGRAAHDPQYPPLERELERLARTARGRDVPVAEVLRTLDAVCRAPLGGSAALDWDNVREWAGRVVIRAYYRGD